MSNRVDFFIPGDEVREPAFHYSACGLDYVYLLNGVIREDDPEYGEIITIRSQDELHKAICAHILEKKTMTNREFKFLRKLMGYTQEELAKEFGVDVQTIANCEKKSRIPMMTQNNMRYQAALFLLPADMKLSVLTSLVKGAPDKAGKGGAFRRERGKLIPHWHERGQLAACG